MNLFVIPTWYPHRCHPLEGIFVREQAVAIGELRPEWSVALSVWGQGTGRLAFSHFRESPRCLIDALELRAPWERALRDNVIEFGQPAYSWNERFLGGNRNGILAVNRENLTRVTRRFGSVDLIHAHVSYPAGWVAMKLSEETGIPFAITEHMGPFPLPVYQTRDGSLLPFIREPLERARARIAVSPALAERIASFGIARPEYVPNVLDERLYSAEPHAARERFVFFTLGGMQPVKGFPDLLQAIAVFVERLSETDRSRVAFRLGGYGPDLEANQALARRLELDRWVSWLGFLERDRARREFHECDCYVLASRHESFGVVLVEAMASGRPVIATRCGGPESLVTDESGLLVGVSQPAEMAEAMLVMFRRERTYDPRALRDGALRQFSRGAVVDQLERIYGDALGATVVVKLPKTAL